MELQIIGTKKCKDTRKAERFFRDRGISYQLVDLASRSLSEGELASIAAKIDPKDLIDTESKQYRKRGFAYMEYDPLEEIAEDPALLRTPVVRSDSGVTVGDQEETWKEWTDQWKQA